jgi:hypothetical protein
VKWVQKWEAVLVYQGRLHLHLDLHLVLQSLPLKVKHLHQVALELPPLQRLQVKHQVLLRRRLNSL